MFIVDPKTNFDKIFHPILTNEAEEEIEEDLKRKSTCMDNNCRPILKNKAPMTPKEVSRNQLKRKQNLKRLKYFDKSRELYMNSTFYAADQDDTEKLDTPNNKDNFGDVQLKFPGNHKDSGKIQIDSPDFKRVNLDEEIHQLSSKFESIKKNILPCEPLKKCLEFTSAFFDVLKTPDDQLVAKVLKLKETLVNLTKTSENPKKNIN